MRRRLVLFDIDGTLITDGGAARDAFSSALADTYGYTGDAGQYDFSGRTDPQIAYLVLRDGGLTDEQIAAKLEDLWRSYLAGLERNVLRGGVRALPGIAPLIAELATNERVTLALLTGNIEAGARLKLSPADLNRFFPFGAFGSDSAKREELPPVAVRRAAEMHGHRFEGADVVIIGDTIYDVRCGTPHGATTIAVASGKTPAETLRAENPSFVFESAEMDGMLAAILG